MSNPSGHCQARPQARLRAVPAALPPRPPRRSRQALSQRLSDLLRYLILGDLILGHLAPRRMREAAWLDGFGFALGSGHQNWWLALLRENTDGNDAGLSYAMRCGAHEARRPIGILTGTSTGLGDPD